MRLKAETGQQQLFHNYLVNVLEHHIKATGFLIEIHGNNVNFKLTAQQINYEY